MFILSQSHGAGQTLNSPRHAPSAPIISLGPNEVSRLRALRCSASGRYTASDAVGKANCPRFGHGWHHIACGWAFLSSQSRRARVLVRQTSWNMFDASELTEGTTSALRVTLLSVTLLSVALLSATLLYVLRTWAAYWAYRSSPEKSQKLAVFLADGKTDFSLTTGGFLADG